MDEPVKISTLIGFLQSAILEIFLEKFCKRKWSKWSYWNIYWKIYWNSAKSDIMFRDVSMYLLGVEHRK